MCPPFSSPSVFTHKASLPRRAADSPGGEHRPHALFGSVALPRKTQKSVSPEWTQVPGPPKTSGQASSLSLSHFSMAENILFDPLCPSQHDLILKVQSTDLHEGLFQTEPFLLTTGSVPSKSYPEENWPQDSGRGRALESLKKEWCLLLCVQGRGLGEALAIFFLGLCLFYILSLFSKRLCEVWSSLFPTSCL